MSTKFVYEVKKYPSDQFVRMAYFCTDKGECTLDELPAEQISTFENLLNERGSEGWELVQSFFGSDGVMTIWKREKNESQLEATAHA
jgi:hypothetical protein